MTSIALFRSEAAYRDAHVGGQGAAACGGGGGGGEEVGRAGRPPCTADRMSVRNAALDSWAGDDWRPMLLPDATRAQGATPWPDGWFTERFSGVHLASAGSGYGFIYDNYATK
jgi:hypothetical protein